MTTTLTQFYSVLDRWQLYPNHVHRSWRCDPDAVIAIGEAGNIPLTGVSRSNLLMVNAYFSEQLGAGELSEREVVNHLYQAALAPQQLRLSFNHNCWYNFIATMTAKVACHIWSKIPPSKQSAELFDRLITPTLNVHDLLTGFDQIY
jgi:hypothetical protein